jgi:hypothetical protein
MAEAETRHVQLLLRRSERLFIEIFGHRKKRICLAADRTVFSAPDAFQRPQRNQPNVSDFGAWVTRYESVLAVRRSLQVRSQRHRRGRK